MPKTPQAIPLKVFSSEFCDIFQNSFWKQLWVTSIIDKQN